MYLIKHYSEEETHYNECEIESFISASKGQKAFIDMAKGIEGSEKAIAFYGFLTFDQESEMIMVNPGDRVYVVNDKGSTVVTIK